MPIYEYTAIDKKGKPTKGSIDAESARAARQKLRLSGIYATELRETFDLSHEKRRDIRFIFRSKGVGLDDLAIATRQLATLIGAGLPVVESLQALSEQVLSTNLKGIIIEIKEEVQEGSSLAKAMAKFPKAFPKLYVNMITSGEASGTLDAVLENLADYLEAQIELRRKITSALFYPALMLVFCTLVVVALLTFVVPTIVNIFIKQGAALPLPTTIMLAISHFLTRYWFLLLLAAAGLVYGARAYYRTEKGKDKIDRWALKVPILGQLLLKIATARMARTLGVLLSNGVGLLESMNIAKNIVNNVHLRRAIEDAREGVKEGKSLAKEFGKSKFFPPMLIHMIAIGETSGRLESMLVKAGKSYENEVNATLAGLTSLIEPVMMIVLGGIVFSIVISILLPMVDLVNLVQQG
ncbi:MAG: type II secretion system protein GspF [Candidatus Dadabacteria bacterium]|nr:MAG: type II secretion system protein GspF [Candidatus Dadabacteria bacterium]